MMLTITNGVNTLKVTKGAYKALYEHQGYTVVHEGGVKTPPPGTMENASGESSQAEIAADGSDDQCVFDPDAYLNGKISPESCGKSGTNPDSAEEYPEDEEEEEEPELSEIPLAEMTKAQLRQYAEQLGIELDGDETKRELRVAIRGALR